jgi:hypothetical protein
MSDSAGFRYLADQITGINLQCLCKKKDHRERGDVLAAFNESHVTSIHPGALRQFVLCPSALLAKSSDDGSDFIASGSLLFRRGTSASWPWPAYI